MTIIAILSLTLAAFAGAALLWRRHMNRARVRRRIARRMGRPS
jgi:hypothetical protein